MALFLSRVGKSNFLATMFGVGFGLAEIQKESSLMINK